MIRPGASRVLIVEDIPENRKTYEIALKLGGHAIVTAGSKQEALEHLRTHTFHAALVDIRLKEHDEHNADGLDVAQAIRAGREGTNTVILSGYGTPESIIKAFEVHKIFRFIRKEQAESDIGSVQTAVAEAVRLATLDLFGQYGVLSALLAGGGANQLIWEDQCLRGLACRGIGELNPMLEAMCRQLTPLLPRRSGEAAAVDPSSRTLEGVYWSKALGVPVHLELTPREPSEPSDDRQLIRNVSVGRFRAIACVAPGAVRSDFVDSIWS